MCVRVCVWRREQSVGDLPGREEQGGALRQRPDGRSRELRRHVSEIRQREESEAGELLPEAGVVAGPRVQRGHQLRRRHERGEAPPPLGGV